MAERIVISGAGLAGSLLAVFLARRGYDVTMLERRPDMRRQRISAGRSINLALAARGIVALERAGLFEDLKRILVAMPGRMIHDAQGGTLYQQYSRHAHEFNWSASRGALNMALMDAAEATGRVEILFEQRVERYDYDSGTLLVHDAKDATRHLPAPVVIATDGAGSPVRASMVERFGVACHEEPLGHAYKELTIPAAADGGFRIARDALHIWPRGGHMLIALPNPDGSFTVTLFMKLVGDAPDEPSFAQLTTPAKLAALFADQFPDAVPLIPDLAYDFFDNPTGQLATLRCARWAVGSQTLLLGDAAHAIVPFHGQGMNCAFEDVVELDQQLERRGCRGDGGGATDWAGLFAEVERRRKPDADAIADMALENYVEMRDLVRDPRFHLIKQVEFLLEGEFPDLFVPRYSMVMFHPEIPYAEAQRRGRLQAELLAELTQGIDDPRQVDLARAGRLLRERIRPG